MSRMMSMLQRGDVRAFLGRHADVALAGLVVLIVAMLVVPLPPLVLDLLISLNIATAVILLLVAIYVSEALKIAAFPTLLLLTTLFRLALEVSATRLILLKGDAGEVIHAFGNFVVAGNLVVGAVIFFILTVIQFVVISKGAERVAEVGARFTLDAMPGKQMAIDAELRAGHIDQAEARRRRALLNRESQFFGAMDGAMKFVKGDAIAGIVVLLANIVGGLVIGVMQRGMELGTAARVYTVLTIGEGLVAQIPALVISTAAGIVVTRVSSEDEGGHLGRDIGVQILGQPKALVIAAVLMGLLALVPGLPAAPFLVLAAIVGFVGWRLLRAPAVATATKAAAREDARVPLLTPVSVDLGAALVHERFTDELFPALRARVFDELGLPLPAVRLRPHTPGLGPRGYALRLQEVTMARGEVVVGGGLALEPPGRLGELGISADPATHPDGSAAAWIAPAVLPAARASGVATLSPEEVITAHLLQVLRRHGFELLGIQEVQGLLDALERTHPALVREVVPKLVAPAMLTDVLRRLLEEGVSIRPLREILGALAEWAPSERDPVALTEHVRAALRRQITARHVGPSGTLGVYLLEVMIEEAVRESVHKTPTGSYLAMEPALSRDILAAVGRVIPTGARAVILTAADVRRYVRRLVETEHPQVSVLSYAELAPEVQLQPLGRVRVA